MEQFKIFGRKIKDQAKKGVKKFGNFTAGQVDNFMLFKEETFGSISSFGQIGQNVCEKCLFKGPECKCEGFSAEMKKSKAEKKEKKDKKEKFTAEEVSSTSTSTSSTSSSVPIESNNGYYHMRRRPKHVVSLALERGDSATVSSPEISYQEAILRQNRPVLSPLRGTNQQQGVYGITDAVSGTSMIVYDPNAKPVEQNIPSNVTAGSTNANAKINVVSSFGTDTPGMTPRRSREVFSSTFASHFN